MKKVIIAFFSVFTILLGAFEPLIHVGFANSDLPLPRVPICGDQDGSEPVVLRCQDFTPAVGVQVFQVPGSGSTDILFDFVFRDALYNDEFGYFLVDDLAGSIGNLKPGDSGYIETAFNRANVIFPSGSDATTADTTLHLNAGNILAFFIIQDDTLTNLLGLNPDNVIGQHPLAFFSIDALNPDNADHFVGYISKVDTGTTQFGFEDFTYDGHVNYIDYDDIVINLKKVLQQGQTDIDSDGLPDDWEMNGVDTDGDGQRDLDLSHLEEVGVNIPPNPRHKDIYVWVDWLKAEDHSHKPDERALQLVKDAFATAPVAGLNPDNLLGINLHIILGSEIQETTDLKVMGSIIPSVYDPNNDIYSNLEFNQIRKQYLWAGGKQKGRSTLFHYALYAHYLPEFQYWCPTPGKSRPGGITPLSALGLLGSDFIVAHESYRERQNGLDPLVQGGLFMHELGHSLNLRHGGVDLYTSSFNFKPNHLSIMNYSFTKGLFFRQPGATRPTPSRLDYSRFDSSDLPTLNEDGKLVEKGGLQATNPELLNYGTIYYNGNKDSAWRIVQNLNEDIDWNFNGIFDTYPVKANTNKDYIGIGPVCSESYTSLSTSNEWEGLYYIGGNIGLETILVPEEYPSETPVEEPDIPPEVVLKVTYREIFLPFTLNR